MTNVEIQMTKKRRSPNVECRMANGTSGGSTHRGDDALRARIEVLASKNTEGELTDAERAEYEGYVHANKLVAILQAKASRKQCD